MDFSFGAVMAVLALGAYDFGRQAGRREMRKLARFGVDLEEWYFEAEPLGVEEPEAADAPAPTPQRPLGRLLTLRDTH